MPYRIFCKCCEKEISWYTIPFYSVDFCNPDCCENYYNIRDKKRVEAEIKFFENQKKQQALDELHFAQERANFAQRREKLDREIQETIKSRKRKDKHVKPKIICDECKIACDHVKHHYQNLNFCGVSCYNKVYNRERSKKDAIKREKEKLAKAQRINKSHCKQCHELFTPEFRGSKYCSQTCKKKIPIKKSNDNWAKRDYEKLLKEQQKRNIKANEYLNRDHVKKQNWTGKNFKAVRG